MDDQANTKYNHNADNSPPPGTMLNQEDSGLDPFTSKLVELFEYKNRYGNLLVPKRYAENPQLGTFVNKQRQLYKKYMANETCTLTAERVELLTKLGFVWNATSMPSTYVPPVQEKDPIVDNEFDNETWWRFHTELRDFIADRLSLQARDENGDYVDEESLLTIHPKVATMIAVSELQQTSPLCKWLTEQRKDLSKKPSRLTEERRISLNELDKSWWLPKRERLWFINFYALVSYKKKYKDTAVPISYRSKSLAQWVHRQRCLYKQKKAGRKSSLTDAREKRLTALGFIWSFEEIWNEGGGSNLKTRYKYR